jgi:Tol biopolymer transport system component
VYSARHGSASWALDIRNLDELEARTLPGTEKAMDPAFSPDGRWIAFAAADGTLRKIAVDGTGLTTLGQLDPAGSVGISWLSSREIVFARWNLAARGLWKIPADGGQAVQFTRFDSATGEQLQLSPQVADGGRLIFYSSSHASNQEITIGVVSAATGTSKVLSGIRGSRALGLADGHLIYLRGDGALMAAPFNTRTLKAGEPTQIFDSVAARGWMAAASLSASGSLLYQRGALVNRIVRRGRQGATEVVMDSARGYAHPRLSPDGRRLAFEVQGGSSSEIWIADLAGRTSERLTRDAFDDRPEWSPDGGRILYSSTRTSNASLWWQPSDGSGTATLVYQGRDATREGVFTPDGRSLVIRLDTPNNNRDIQLLPLTGPRVPRPLITTPDDEKEPRVSPDSRWVAYVSNASGREEVYVRALEGAGGRIAVSSGGGGEPLWSHDGRRLYYRAGPALMQATVSTSPALAVTARDTLFQGPYATDIYHPGYDVTPDDQSFIMLQPDEQARQLVMIVNWTAELHRRFAASR